MSSLSNFVLIIFSLGFLLLLIILIIFLSYLSLEALAVIIFYFKNGVIFVPTNSRALHYLFKRLGVVGGKTLIDLGSGKGDVLLAAAKRGFKAVGYEVNPLLIFSCWLKAKIFGVKNLTILRKSFFEADLSKADFIYCFLLPEVLEKLEDVFKTAKREAVFISYKFPINLAKTNQDWLKIKEIIKIPNSKSNFFIYEKQ